MTAYKSLQDIVVATGIFLIALAGLSLLEQSQTSPAPIPQEIVKISQHIAKVNPTAPADRIAIAIYQSAKVCNVSPYLVTALMETESRFYVDATSETGARGLMQIIKSTAEYIGLPWVLAYDVELNTEKGACYLAKHVNKYQDRLDLAVRRYNGNDDPYFAQKVLSRYVLLEGKMDRVVVVKKGDTLAKLAEIYLGNAGMYPVLAANNGITNPDLIEVGQKIVIRG